MEHARYETVVAQELKAHGFDLYYYDNKKSGKDYQEHSALDKFLQIKEYNIQQAFVLSNAQKVEIKDGVTYLPIYYIMCIEPPVAEENLLL